MQVQERVVLTEMNLRVREGEKRAWLKEARPQTAPSLRARTLLTALVHRLSL